MLEKALTFVLPGLIYGVGALGLALIFRFLRFPDLTTLGSIMVGGVSAVWATNSSGYVVGLVVATCSGALLGLLSGAMISKLRIQPVLAGIIIYTAAFTLGFSLTNGGTTSMAKHAVSPFASTFRRGDVIAVCGIVLLLCCVASLLIRTKPGSLMLALTADRRYVRHRHRYRNAITVAVLIIGNAMVALSGGLYAMKDRSAQVHSHMDFLPFALGAIFGGNALAAWLARKLDSWSSDSEDGRNRRHPYVIRRTLREVVSTERDDSTRLGFLLAVYALGCLFFTEVAGLVSANAFTTIHPGLQIDPDYQYLITALIIVFCVWWSGAEEES